MKHFMTRISALLLALMMLIPMTAGADAADQAANYGEITLKDVVVNVMGTELDFTGIALSLVGGIDADNRDALIGINAAVGDSSAAILAELTNDGLYAYIANKALSMSYDTLSAMSGIDADTVSGIVNTVFDSLSTGLNITAILQEINAERSAKFNELLNAKLAEATAEEYTVTVGDTDYAGSLISVYLTSDELRDNLLQPVADSYYNGKFGALIKPFISTMNMAMSSQDIDMGDFSMDKIYDVVFEHITDVQFPTGLTVNVIGAQLGDGEYYVANEVPEFEMDMSDYITGIISDIDPTAEIPEELAAISKFNMSEFFDEIFTTNLTEDAVLTPEDMNVTYTSLFVSVGLAGAETNLFEIEGSAELSDKEPTYADYIATFDLSSFEADMPVIDVNLNFTTEDGGRVLNAEAFMGDESVGKVAITTVDTELGGIIYVDFAQGEESATLATITYEKQDDESYNITIEAMGMVSASFNAYCASGADYSWTNTLANMDTLDLFNATEEEQQEVLTAIQGEFMSLLGSAMQVPGVQALMSSAISAD